MIYDQYITLEIFTNIYRGCVLGRGLYYVSPNNFILKVNEFT